MGFINRAKDELVSPDDFDAFVEAERDRYEQDHGSFDAAAERLDRTGHLQPVRDVRGDYAKVRARERAEAAGFEVKRLPARRARAHRRAGGPPQRHRHGRPGEPRPPGRGPARAHRRARRHLRGGRRRPGGHAPRRDRPRLPRLRGDDRAARPPGLRRADRPGRPPVQDPPQRASKVAAPVPLHPGGRVPGRQRRPDRADRAPGPHAGPARQRHGRGRRRPVHLPLPGRQLRRLRRVRHPLLPAARACRRRRARPRAPAPPRHRAELPQRQPRPGRRQPSHRPQRDPVRARQASSGPTSPTAPPSSSTSAPGPRTRPSPSSMPSARSRPPAAPGTTSPSCTASTSTATPSWTASRPRTSRSPSSAA